MKKAAFLLIFLPFVGMQAQQTQETTFRFLENKPTELSVGTNSNTRTGNPRNERPLFILDGLQIDSVAVNSINPNDIKSITVLKDSKAISIYGERAANGVVIIETKCRVDGTDAKPIQDAHQRQRRSSTIY